MILNEIRIDSFRSITEQKIEMNDRCIGFIGTNESGKSNILKAIRSLDWNYSVSAKDISKITNKLPRVTFAFQFEKHENQELQKKLKEVLQGKVLPSADELAYKVSFDSISISASVDAADFKRLRYVSISKIGDLSKYSVLKDRNLVPEGTKLNVEGRVYDLKQISYINTSLIPNELSAAFSSLTNNAFNNFIINSLQKAYSEFIPKVVFWEYDSKTLLPSELTYDDFLLNDEAEKNCLPLYNILILCERLGVSNLETLKAKIQAWKIDSSQRRKDSKVIGEDINRYIKTIWEDYNQELVIEFEETKITIHINDPVSSQMNFYEMESRSQGFKTFISFILTIAAESDKHGSNMILILDEPETHLHPSGVRYMRNELLKLSEKGNYVFFATHSIFMIDRRRLKRHIITKKENELTKLVVVERNNITQEAVIYEALGTKIDEFSISNKNILFEGELDLYIFDFCCKNLLKKNSKIHDYQLLDGGGTKRIEQFFANKIIPFDSEWFVILDNDSPGQKLQQAIKNKYSSSKNILSFEFYSNKSNFELEDILPSEILKEAVSKAIQVLDIAPEHQIEYSQDKPFSTILETFKAKNRLSPEVSTRLEETFKELLSADVLGNLSAIQEEKTMDDKVQSFKKKFPQYFDFYTRVLKHFQINLD